MSGSSSASYRACVMSECKVRLPKAAVDPHTVCSNCRKHICMLNDRCHECASLSENEWRAYDKYVRKLERDRLRRSSSRSASLCGSVDVGPNSPVPLDPNPVVLSPAPEIVPVETNMLSAMMESIRALESKVSALQDKCCEVTSAPSAVEGASDRPHHASRPGPLLDSQDSGREHVESRRRVTGNPHRSGVPSAGPEDVSQAAQARTRVRVLKDCFSSSDMSSPRRGWNRQIDSRPLKRSFREEDASRPLSPTLCSSPEFVDAFPPQKKYRTSSEEDVFERPRALLRQEKRIRTPPRPSASRFRDSPEREASPTRTLIASMQQQLSSFIAERESRSRPRRKDVRLPVKRSRRSPSPAPRSSPSSASPARRGRNPRLSSPEGVGEDRRDVTPGRPPLPSRSRRHVHLFVDDARQAPDVGHAARRDALRDDPDVRHAARRDARLDAQEARHAARRDAPMDVFDSLQDAPPAVAVGSRVVPGSPAALHASSSSKQRSLRRVSSPTSLCSSPPDVGDRLRVSESEDEIKDQSSSSDYQILVKLLKELFPDKFLPAVPLSPPSQLTSTKSRKAPGFLKMTKSLSTKRAFKKVHLWMDSRKAQGKSSFALPPSRLSGKAAMWYETGEDLGLRLPSSSKGDFASLVDSSRRSHLSTAKIPWTLTEMDHLLKGLFKTIEVFNFLDWCLGALDLKSRSQDSISLSDLLSVLSCMDKAVRDGSDELASHFATGVLKKRSLFCGFATKSVSLAQKGELLFAPLSSHLFPASMVKDIAASLQEKTTQDLLAQSSKRPAVPVTSTTSNRQHSPKMKKPFRAGSSSKPSSRGKNLSRGKALARGRGKK